MKENKQMLVNTVTSKDSLLNPFAGKSSFIP